MCGAPLSHGCSNHELYSQHSSLQPGFPSKPQNSLSNYKLSILRNDLQMRILKLEKMQWLVQGHTSFIFIYFFYFSQWETKEGLCMKCSLLNLDLCLDFCRLPWWLSGKESTCNAGDAGLIPGLVRSPGDGNGNPLWYSCLGNPMDRGAWWATVYEAAKELDTT